MSQQKKMFQNVCIKDIGPELNIFFLFFYIRHQMPRKNGTERQTVELSRH